ncbi:MAG: hypothetical protein WAR41_17500, partial [Azonexus sp.]
MPRLPLGFWRLSSRVEGEAKRENVFQIGADLSHQLPRITTMLHTVNKPASPRVAPLSITKTVLPTTKTFEIEIGVTNKKQVSAEATSYCAT